MQYVRYLKQTWQKAPIILKSVLVVNLKFSSSGDIFSTVPKLIVGSTVSVYVINAITNVNQPIIVFHLLKLNGALFMY
jgi:hypothetical protein